MGKKNPPHRHARKRFGFAANGAGASGVANGAPAT